MVLRGQSKVRSPASMVRTIHTKPLAGPIDIRRLAGDFPLVIDYREKQARARDTVGQVLGKRGHFAESVNAFRESIDLSAKLAPDASEQPKYMLIRPRSIATWPSRTCLPAKVGRPRASFRQALGIYERVPGTRSPHAGHPKSDRRRARSDFALVLRERGELREARSSWSRRSRTS